MGNDYTTRPARGTEAYRWWAAGATAEAAARDDELSRGARELRDAVEDLARMYPDMSEVQLAATMFYIFAGPLPWRLRLKVALRGRV